MKKTKPAFLISMVFLSLLITGCTGDVKESTTNTPIPNSSSSSAPQPSKDATPDIDTQEADKGDAEVYNDVETINESTKHGTKFFNVDYRDITVPQELINEYGDIAKNLPRDILFALFESMEQDALQIKETPQEFKTSAIDQLGNLYFTYDLKEQIIKDIETFESSDKPMEERTEAWMRVAGTALTVSSKNMKVLGEVFDYNDDRFWAKNISDFTISKDADNRVIATMKTVIYAPIGEDNEYRSFAQAKYTYTLILNGDRWIIDNIEVGKIK